MVKTMFLCRRRPDISHERYSELLLRGHVPIALRHHPTMRRYTVNIVDESYGGAAPLDSVGSLWFDSLADFRDRLYDSPEGVKIVGRDVVQFMGGADGYATTEIVQRPLEPATPLGQPTPGVKLVAAVRRVPSMAHEDFVRHWQERHVPLVLADPLVAGYVTNVVSGALDGSPPTLDGIAELQFASAEDFATHMAMEGERYAALRADIPRFVGDAAAYRATEHVQR